MLIFHDSVTIHVAVRPSVLDIVKQSNNSYSLFCTHIVTMVLWIAKNPSQIFLKNFLNITVLFVPIWVIFQNSVANDSTHGTRLAAIHCAKLNFHIQYGLDEFLAVTY